MIFMFFLSLKFCTLFIKYLLFLFVNIRVEVSTQGSTSGAQIYRSGFTGVAVQVENFQVRICGNFQ
jgi:hypothetical protein